METPDQPDYSRLEGDREMKKYFRKIIYSISWGLILLLAALTFGIYYKLALGGSNPVYYSIVFYVAFLTGIALYVRYLVRIWKNGGR
jgi:hypothetical protein